jgi:hypothetical protein
MLASYDILKPFEASVYTDQNPEFIITRSARKDRKKQDKTFEISMQDPQTQMRITKEREEKEKESVVEGLMRQSRRKGAREVVAKLAPRAFPSEEDTAIYNRTKKTEQPK